MFDAIIGWYRQLLEAISSSALYRDYISVFPAPFNNVPFLCFLGVVLIFMAVRGIVELIYGCVRKSKVRQRILEDEELRKENEKNTEAALEGYAKAFAKTIEEQHAEKIDLQQKLYSSEHDELTGLKNRKMFNDRMEQYQSEHMPYIIVCFDVNNLKTANDVFGHAKGDELLQTVTGVIAKYLGKENVYRVGGDEFNVLTSKEEFSEDLLTKIDEELEQITAEKDDGLAYETAYGYADSAEAETSADVMAIADSRMYENKKMKKAKNPKSRNSRDVQPETQDA